MKNGFFSALLCAWSTHKLTNVGHVTLCQHGCGMFDFWTIMLATLIVLAIRICTTICTVTGAWYLIKLACGGAQ